MNKRKIAVGPGASSLILIAVVLALSVLAVLTMISARSDEALALRSVETRQEVYGLFADAERSLAKLDAVLADCLEENPEDPDAYLALVKEKLPEGMKLQQSQVSWTEKSENRSLECAVRIMEPGSEKRTVWTMHNLGAGEIWEDEGFDDWDDWEDDEDFDEDLDEGEEESEDEDSEEGDLSSDADSEEREEIPGEKSNSDGKGEFE